MEHRRFLVSDGMALVVAVAVGAAWTRTIYADRMELFLRSPSGLIDTVTSVWMLLCPTASTLSVVILVMRLRGPRPRASRLVRQPGFEACLIASTGVAVATVMEILHAAGVFRLHPHPHHEELFIFLWFGIGSMILGAWICLRMGGRWRAERSWIDRAGRALGMFWVTVPVSIASAYFAVTVIPGWYP
jgi:hypothetical protein